MAALKVVYPGAWYIRQPGQRMFSGRDRAVADPSGSDASGVRWRSAPPLSQARIEGKTL